MLSSHRLRWGPRTSGAAQAEQSGVAGRPHHAVSRHRQRNRTLNRCAFKVFRYVAGGLLDDQEVTLAFTTVARAIGLGAAETARTLASARTAGLANPRTVPTTPGVRIGEDGA